MNAKGSILVVDDEPNMCRILEEILQAEHFEVRSACDGVKALLLLKEAPPDIVISDLRMPKLDGMELLKEVKSHYPRTEVILMSAYATVESAVEAMKLGAYDYVLKPFQIDEILMTVGKARERQTLVSRNRILEAEVENKYSFDKIIGKCSAITHVFSLIERVAPTDSTVLITGESGTGKELIAKAIHYHSLRKEKSFITINCAGLPEPLLESELFGHEKGSFTGAISRKFGLFEMAHEGTFFMDEVGELSPALQVKLLRVLQESEFRRVGGLDTIKVNVRVLAATNKDLQEAVQNKEFREDLFFRLNVIPIHVPPLRERAEDIPLLVDKFIDRIFEKRNMKEKPKMIPETLKLLTRYHWPGNVRELENLIELLLTMIDHSEILPDDLPDRFHARTQFDSMDSKNYQEAKISFESQYFSKLLSKHRWNVTRAAEEAQMSRRHLHEKIRTLGLKPPWEEKEPVA
jgi:DNA-binding NtrC family response regulator